jgi:hypothetical protein
MRNVAARNTSSQNLRGIDASARRDKRTSTMCLCFSQRNHFVDVHEGRRLDVKYQS